MLSKGIDCDPAMLCLFSRSCARDGGRAGIALLVESMLLCSCRGKGSKNGEREAREGKRIRFFCFCCDSCVEEDKR